MKHGRAQIASADTPQRLEEAVRHAAELLRAGEVVALPTETVYGLAANALDAAAVARIFAAKGRPAHNPLIVHVASVAMARHCVAGWPALAEELAQAFWPGPLTLVLPKSPAIPEIVTAGGSTVAVRWPSHPVMQAVIRECGFPLAAPSANLSNQISPTCAEHVRKQLGNRVQLIVDGGQCQVGIESTVLDLAATPPRLLRPGIIDEASLLAVTGELVNGAQPGGIILRSPGQLRRHYAPRAKLVIWSWTDDQDLLRQAAQTAVPAPKIAIIAHHQIPGAEGFGRIIVIPRDAEAFARSIYAALHQCDEVGVELIVVEALPAGNEWRAIQDRLNRASHE
jgi:L-threonylcarbamoyladenylate synthase